MENLMTLDIIENPVPTNYCSQFIDIEQEFELEEPEYCRNDMIASCYIKSFDHPDNFLEFLNKHFKPEINLTPNIEDIKSLQNNLKEPTYSDNNEINLNYKGHKNMCEKGKNAERRDVVYKTFIRSVRRYLWSLFSSKFISPKTSKK